MTPNNPNYSDLLNALSLLLAVENLNENRQQSQYNDVHKANDKQAEYLLNEINSKFAEQNENIDRILKIQQNHTEILNKICLALKCDVSDIMEVVAENENTNGKEEE
jgi:DNA-binding Xre family transcriptional regulator